ncbi:malto-oligosyltrehalose synthase [soil metagenome]
MTATYRIQVHPDFGFADVQELLPYLRDLGISHVYLSPITESRPGSTHGYDVIDHNEVRDDLGGREGLNALMDACIEHELKLVLDWVPNHAGVGSRNVYWQDVLAYGPNSPYARYFDIEWKPLKPELLGKVLLPFLGKPYGDALDSQEIAVTYDDGRFYASYFESRFALAPSTYDLILAAALEHSERSDAYWDLKELHDAYSTLTSEEREKAEALRLRLAAILEADQAKPWLELPAETIHDILERQCWRLSFWKTAGHEINYRRFFDINELVGLRMEDDQVFWDAHRLLGELLAHEAVEGVRIDHIDGMFDPHRYLDRLRELGGRSVWVEKILAHGEALPEDWPVEGETGYGFMNDAMHVLLDPESEHAIDRTYRRFVDDNRSYEDVVHASKAIVVDSMLSSELSRLAYELDRISEADYNTRDFTLAALQSALAEVVSAFDRYRTYLPYDEEGAREVLLKAIYAARQRHPATERSAYDFLQRVVMGDIRPDLMDAQRAWVGRFQQYTAPVAAKGVEDTAFYRFVRFAALNEVGGEPGDWAMPPAAFHARARHRAHRYPRNLLATATHDHKRGEDTRMRMIAIADVPQQWEDSLVLLADIGQQHTGIHGPSRRDQYLFFQTLAALWHGSDHANLGDRLWTYMQKAAREAKLDTSWIDPSEDYESDLESFVRGVVSDERTSGALDDLSAELARLGFANSLTQLTLKLTTPGLPDFYQGCELQDLSLVDPDNRRPVDYDLRRRLLDENEATLSDPSPEAVVDLINSREEGAKFYLTARLLRLRRVMPELFEGDYRALDLEGPGAENWVAFSREGDGSAIVVIVPRRPIDASESEQEHASVLLPDTLQSLGWTDWISGARIEGGESIDTSSLAIPWSVLVVS